MIEHWALLVQWYVWIAGILALAALAATYRARLLEAQEWVDEIIDTLSDSESSGD